MAKLFLSLGSIGMFLGIALGAFAAHGLKHKLTPEMLTIFEVGVRYNVYHALALLMLGCLQLQVPAMQLKPVGLLFVAGTVLFSGSLYALSFSGIRVLGAITPLGGVCFLAAWLLLAIKVYRHF